MYSALKACSCRPSSMARATASRAVHLGQREDLAQVHAGVHALGLEALALAEMHGRQAVARAIDDGLQLQAFSAEYIAHILAARQRIGPEPSALQLTRASDLLELEIPAPDLSIYDRE